jgi:hypothetical protein
LNNTPKYSCRTLSELKKDFSNSNRLPMFFLANDIARISSTNGPDPFPIQIKDPDPFPIQIKDNYSLQNLIPWPSQLKYHLSKEISNKNERK